MTEWIHESKEYEWTQRLVVSAEIGALLKPQPSEQPLPWRDARGNTIMAK